jgi:hypothetical protein
MQQTPQQMAMPQGVPSQMGIGALAAQRQQAGQMDPRLMAMMQALGGNRPQPAQQTGGMMPPGVAAPGTNQPDPQMLAAMQALQQQGAQAGMPVGVPAQRPMPGMSAPGGVQFMDNLKAPVAPGDVLVQRTLPVGAGGKGTAAPGTRPQVSPRPQMDPRMMRMLGGR